MTITLSQQAFDELFQETVEPSQHPDPDDVMDVVYKYPRRLGQVTGGEFSCVKG